MNSIDFFSPSGPILSYLIAVIAQVTCWSLAALIVTALLSRSGPALRHLVLFSGLLAVALVPAAVAIMNLTEKRTIDIGAHLVDFGLRDLRSARMQGTSRPEGPQPRRHESTSPSASQGVAVTASAPSSDGDPIAVSEKSEFGGALSRGAMLLICVWLIGLALQSIKFIRGLWTARQILRNAQSCADSCWQNALTESIHSLKVRRRPRLLTSSEISSPLVVGIRRPAIVLPQGMEQTNDAEALRGVMLHELAHIVRRDTLIGLLQRVVDIVWWPHPLVTRLNQRLSGAREEICDNDALCHAEKHAYARTLVQLALPAPPPRWLASVVGMMEPRWPLEVRIRGLLDDQRRLELRANRLKALTLVALTCVGMFFFAGAGTESRTENDVLAEVRSLGGQFSDLNGMPGGTERVMITQSWKGTTTTLRDLKYIKGVREIWFSGTTIDEIVLEDLPDLEQIIFNVNFHDETQQKQVNWHNLPIRTVRLRNLPMIKSFDNRGGGNNLTDTQVSQLVLEEMDQLKILKVNGLQLTDNVLNAVVGTPNLEELELCRPLSTHSGGRTDISDDGLTALASLKRLTSLDLSGARITDQDIRTIETLTSLKRLGLNATDVTDAGLARLASLKSLVDLGIGETSVTDLGLKQVVTDHPDLERLYLGGSAVTAHGLRALAGLRRLKMVSLDSGQLSAQSCTVLGTLTVELLHLSGPPKVSGSLSGLSGVRSLMIEGTGTLTVADGSLNGLKELYLRGADSATLRSVFQNFRAMEQLETLDISHGWTTVGEYDNEHSLAIDDDMMQALSPLASLKFLSIAGYDSGIGDRGVAALAGLKSLESVLLPETLATDQGVARLAELKNLSRLRIGGKFITNQALNRFRGHNQLRELIFTNTAITWEAIADLQAILPNAVIQANQLDQP